MYGSDPPRSSPRPRAGSRSIHIRLDENLAREVDDFCNERLVSRNKIFERAIRDLMEKLAMEGST